MMSLKEQLDKIMCPKSIAVVGASNKEHTIGSDIMKRLQEYKFTGKIYPINPKGGEIQGLKAYTSVLEVEDSIDLALIVVNSKFVLSTIDQCNEKGIKGLCIITAGFKETGKEGVELEKQKSLLQVYQMSDIRFELPQSCLHLLKQV